MDPSQTLAETGLIGVPLAFAISEIVYPSRTLFLSRILNRFTRDS